MWVGKRHPGIFYTVLFASLLRPEDAESDSPEEPRQTNEEFNHRCRDYIGLTDKDRTKGDRKSVV